MLAGCWLDAGWMLLMLAGCWLDAGWLQIWAEYTCYLKLDENLKIFIEIRPDCERGAHVIQESSQNAIVGHMCYKNQARIREWSTVAMIIEPECESGAHYIRESSQNA
jgi:hypothetical protein